jgi:hypothetical protein
MSETQWKQFVQLYAEKNQHLSHQEVLQMAKKPFQELQKYFSQKGGAKRHFTIQSMIGDDMELDIDAKLTVGDLKTLISTESGIEKDRQKLIHWTEGWRDGAFEVLENSTKLKSIPEVTRLDLMLGTSMCQIVSIEDDVKYLSTKYEMKDPPCRLWTFALENGEEFKVYRTNRAKAGGRYITYLVPRKDEDITTTKARIYNNIYDVLGYSASTFGATARDGFVIERTLKTHETPENKALHLGDPSILVKHYDVQGGYLIHLPVYCECGIIVDLDKMKAHVKTKKHQTGDEEGRRFMERASAYVSEWTP